MENLVASPSFWANKKVLLTGHTGFKGSWLSLWLSSMGAKVTGLALRPPTETNLFDLANVAKCVDSIIGDIRDYNVVKSAFEHEPEIVIHMAAQSLVKESYLNPVETYAVNVMGTVNVLAVAKDTKSVKAVVNVTSDKCYENKEEKTPFVETDRMGGHDPYSNSKGCAELVAQSFADCFYSNQNQGDTSKSLASARAGNVIGGGDWADNRLLPDIYRAILSRDDIVLRNPSAIRPWQHVLEPLNGYLLLAQKLYEHGNDFAGGWNFGPDEHDFKTVQWVVEYICDHWKNPVSWNVEKSDIHPEAHTLTLNSDKSKNRLNWVPRWTIESALNSTIEWMSAFEAQEDMNAVTMKQISEFIGR